MSDADTTWQRRADVLQRAALGELVLLAVDGLEPITLTAPGPALWAVLVEPVTLAEIADAFAEDGGADDEQEGAVTARAAHQAVVGTELRSLLDRLVALGLVTANRSPAPPDGAPARRGV